MPKKTVPGFYAVRAGRQTGVFLTWAECDEQIRGFAGARYKKFTNAAEAEAFVAGDLIMSPTDASTETSANHGKGKKRAMPTETEDESGWDIVYSDGACKGNGQPGSVAGVGVWWGRDDPRNMAERCPGDQTNNRAELIAILRVLETTPMAKKPLKIKTDSRYSIDCFQSWLPKWQQNGFKTATGAHVKNVGIIRYLSAQLDARASYGQQIYLHYVKGHNGEEGNEGADAQANKGTLFPAVPERDWEKLELELRERIEAGQLGSADQPNVVMEVKGDDLPTGTAMKVRKVSTEGTPSTPAARLGSAPEATAISTGVSDLSSAPERNSPAPTLELSITEIPSVSESAAAGPSKLLSPRKTAMSSKTQDIIAALRSPPRAKPGSPSVSPRRKITPSSKVSSVMKTLFPSGSASGEQQTSSSLTKKVSSPMKSRSRIPLPASPSKTIYSQDLQPPPSSLNAQPTQDEEGESHLHSHMNFLAALEEKVSTAPGDPPSLGSVPAAQPMDLAGQSTRDNLPKSPQQLMVNKDIDFSMYVDCLVDDDELWKDIYP